MGAELERTRQGASKTMASSGIKPKMPECGDAWAKVKSSRDATRAVTFEFTPKRDAIVVGQEIPLDEPSEEANLAAWATMVENLPPKGALYIAWEWHYVDRGSGYSDGDLDTLPTKSKLVFFTWAPDSAKPQVKMLVPSSSAGLQEVCDGPQVVVQMNSLDDTTPETIARKLGITLPNNTT